MSARIIRLVAALVAVAGLAVVVGPAPDAFACKPAGDLRYNPCTPITNPGYHYHHHPHNWHTVHVRPVR